MRKRIAVSAAVLFFTSLQPAQPSGCFGGEPDISPRNGSMSVPSNGRVTIARRSPAGVSWLGPNRQPIAFRERQAGSGPSAARILVSDALLQPGVHTVQTTDPDLTRTFTVISSADSLPPLLSGTLKLEAF
ncbi:MAG: hypothetical protein H7Y20_03400, partial [Bryobacteraceae bacterium]|nr:hypothetical protein [Bryobacteraceae bacterium]